MSKLFAYQSYREVDAAITWLEALGFEATTRQRDGGGATRPRGAPGGRRGGDGRSGGSSVFAPEKTEWGTERARVLDPEGYEWSFGTYEPGGSW